MADAVVIGGGFYGTAIAIYLAKTRGLRNVVLVEKEKALLTRASYTNQARIHNGYHYPRSFTTAYRSRINFPRFIRDWPEAVTRDFFKLYAIPRHRSKVTANQFKKFCREIGAKLEPAPASLKALFEPHLMEEIFLVEEYAFDTTKLAAWAQAELDKIGIDVRLETQVMEISKDHDAFSVSLKSSTGHEASISTHFIFNCTYSGLNQIGGDFPPIRTGLKQEITEMALLEMPSGLENIGVTVMDGPFFSIMPFPARKLHTLSHVRYTPHSHWSDQRGVDPYTRLDNYERDTRLERMIRDVGRYMPSIYGAIHRDSLFEIKTVLEKNESDDGRPILFETYPELPGCYSILGGKIDNIYDVLEKLDGEDLTLNPSDMMSAGRP